MKFVLTCVLLAAVRTAVASPCDGAPQCDCSGAVMAHCSNRQLDRIPSFSAAASLYRDYYFSGNRLTQVSAETLRRFAQVQYLYLDDNTISSLAVDSFAGNTRLTHLFLKNNSLTELPVGLFNATRELMSIDFSHNRIESIEAGVFAGLERLSHVRLNENRIRTIAKTAFDATTMLDILYLENNLLETAYWDWIKHWDLTESEGYELYLDSNPWSCDCRMKRFWTKIGQAAWIRDPARHCREGRCRVTVPTCADPPQHHNKLLSTLLLADLACRKPQIHSTETERESREGDVTELTCEADGLPVPRVQILDAAGNALTEVRRGNVSHTIVSLRMQDAGEYVCVANGTDSNSHTSSVTQRMVLVVHKSSHTLAIAVSLSCVAIVVVICATVFRRRILRFRFRLGGYGSLSSTGAPEDDGRMSSMMGNSLGAPTAAIDADSDDECVRYSKDDDREYLV